VHHASRVLPTRVWPCCAPSCPPRHDAFRRSSTSPAAPSLPGGESHSFLPVAQKPGCPAQPPAVATRSNADALLFAMLQPIASRRRGCRLRAAPRVGRHLRSARGRQNVLLHSADTVLFSPRKLSSLCVSLSQGTSRHTSGPASLPPAESGTSLQHLALGPAQKP